MVTEIMEPHQGRISLIVIIVRAILTTRIDFEMVDLDHQDISQIITRLHYHPKEAQAISLPTEGIIEEAASLLHYPVLAVRCPKARNQN